MSPTTDQAAVGTCSGLPARGRREFLRTLLGRAAGALLTLASATGLHGGIPEARSGEAMPLAEFVGRVNALEAKDYYLNVEYGFHSDFLATPVRLAGVAVPSTRQQLLQLLGRWGVPCLQDGEVVVIQDPALKDFAGRNPLEITLPEIGRDQVGLSAIITAFGVGAGVGGMIGGDEFERTEKLMIESRGPLTLRRALNRVSRKYHLEWSARVALAEPAPDRADSLSPDGKPVPRNPLPKGAVFLGLGGAKWWQEGVREKETNPAKEATRPVVD